MVKNIREHFLNVTMIDVSILKYFMPKKNFMPTADPNFMLHSKTKQRSL